VLAAYRSQRIGAITGRTTEAAPGSDMTGAAMHTAAIRLLLASRVHGGVGLRWR